MVNLSAGYSDLTAETMFTAIKDLFSTKDVDLTKSFFMEGVLIYHICFNNSELDLLYQIYAFLKQTIIRK